MLIPRVRLAVMHYRPLPDYPSPSPSVLRILLKALGDQPGFNLRIVVTVHAQGQPVTQPPACPVRPTSDYMGRVQPVSPRSAHLAAAARPALNNVSPEYVAGPE